MRMPVSAWAGATAMSVGDAVYTAEDYWNLPDGQRAELIDGELYDLAAPSRTHQRLVLGIGRAASEYIESHKVPCEADIAPFAVNLRSDDSTFVEPDVLVVCDKSQLSDRGCEGAPDFIVEVVSPSSRRMDYATKNALYSDAGVREYWIVDPALRRTTVYYYERDPAPLVLPFDMPIESGVCPGFRVVVADVTGERDR